MTPFAFALMKEEPTVGRSFEYDCYDFIADEVRTSRFTVLGRSEVKVAGEKIEALEVEVLGGMNRYVRYHETGFPRLYAGQLSPGEEKIKKRRFTSGTQ